MYTSDVLTWPGTLSDGSTCYGAWCSYVLGVWGQGATEEEALAEITSVMTEVILHPWEDGKSLADPQDAAAEMAEIVEEISAERIPYKMHKVSISTEQPAEV
jgi:predicted RNase H-like HicB family nuclease